MGAFCVYTTITDDDTMPFTLRSHQQRALDALANATHGQVHVPTGGGKTLIMIEDLKRRLLASERPLTVLVVAPRILLANQLCDEFWTALNGTVDAAVMHVHSGETSFNSSTKVDAIKCHDGVCRAAGIHQLIFTTYHSLRRINEADIDIDIAYYDEAHNSTRSDFFPEIVACSAQNYYFFTATPKHTSNPLGRGMNNRLVYGPVLESVPAPELINNGSIIPPTITTYQTDFERGKGLLAADNDRHTLLGILDSLDEDKSHKILVAAPGSRVMWKLLAGTGIIEDLQQRGYDVLHITSKYGAWVNKTKVNREQFFETLTAWGKDPERKFIMFHYSILSEGINVPGLTQVVLLRQLPIIEMAQTIGRVIRLDRDDAADIASGRIKPGVLHNYRKRTGFVTVPVYANHGKGIAKRLQNVVDCIFVKGVPAVSIH